MNESNLPNQNQVLETKDSVAGQQELFENAEDDDVEMEDADSEDLDSDVEVIDASDESSPDEDEADEDEEEDEDEDDENLKEFDAKLAAVLKTHRADQDADAESSSSDADMNDDEMEVVDEQLAKYFRARNNAQSKKKDRTAAKVAMHNFKNRVLDLLEIYVKKSHSNPVGIAMILPLLRFIRITHVTQLSSKAGNVLREYARLCKGAAVPKIDSDEPVWPVLRAVHQEATRSGPPNHASACSQASLLLVKTLTAYEKDAINGIVDIYAETRKQHLLSKKCHVQPAFFSDWNNWCVSASKQLKE
jgi:DNA polymerase phi